MYVDIKLQFYSWHNNNYKVICTWWNVFQSTVYSFLKNEATAHQKQTRATILSVSKSESVKAHLTRRYSIEIVRLILWTRKDAFGPILFQPQLEEYPIHENIAAPCFFAVIMVLFLTCISMSSDMLLRKN